MNKLSILFHCHAVKGLNADKYEDFSMKKEIKEIETVFYERKLCYQQRQDGITVIDLDECEATQLVCRVVETTKRVIASDEPLIFTVTIHKRASLFMEKLECNELGDDILQGIHWCDVINYSLRRHRFDPHYHLFYECAREQKLLMNGGLFGRNNKSRKFDSAGYCDLLNGFVEMVRSRGRVYSFKQDIVNHVRLQESNYKGMLDYIDALFSRHSRLLVLRVDFSYREELSPAYGQNNNPGYFYEMYDRAKKDREHFFRNTRTNSIFENMLGYIWRLEYSRLSGFHYHLIFFFNGSKVQNDYIHANRLGEYWANTITNGDGRYHNCNADKARYKHLGIGMMNYYDEDLREGLKKVCNYLTKVDAYVKLSLPDNGRMFGRGSIPSECNLKRGRPRETEIFPRASLE